MPDPTTGAGAPQQEHFPPDFHFVRMFLLDEIKASDTWDQVSRATWALWKARKKAEAFARNVARQFPQAETDDAE